MSTLPTVGQTVFVYRHSGAGARLAVVKSVGERCLVIYDDGTADYIIAHNIVTVPNALGDDYGY